MTEELYYKSPFNILKIEIKNNKIVSLKKAEENNSNKLLPTSEIGKHIYLQLDEYFQGKRTLFDVPYELSGTSFQKNVWAKLLEIPYGANQSYKYIAIQIGKEKGFRAVGKAIGKNPILIIIPCHRVIGSDGSITGYAGGIEMKQGLLGLERNNNQNFKI